MTPKIAGRADYVRNRHSGFAEVDISFGLLRRPLLNEK
jgi:hypothetical protein